MQAALRTLESRRRAASNFDDINITHLPVTVLHVQGSARCLSDDAFLKGSKAVVLTEVAPSLAEDS